MTLAVGKKGHSGGYNQKAKSVSQSKNHKRNPLKHYFVFCEHPPIHYTSYEDCDLRQSGNFGRANDCSIQDAAANHVHRFGNKFVNIPSVSWLIL